MGKVERWIRPAVHIAVSIQLKYVAPFLIKDHSGLIDHLAVMTVTRNVRDLAIDNLIKIPSGHQ